MTALRSAAASATTWSPLIRATGRVSVHTIRSSNGPSALHPAGSHAPPAGTACCCLTAYGAVRATSQERRPSRYAACNSSAYPG